MKTIKNQYLFRYFANFYDVFIKNLNLGESGYLLKEIESQDCDIIYDVGGGTGILADILVQKGKNVYLIDPCNSMTKIAKKRNSKIRIISSNFGEETNIPKADVIFFRDSFHHIQNQKVVLLHSLKKLNTKGRIIVQDFNPKSFFAKLIFIFEWFCFENPHPIELKHLQQDCEKIGFVSKPIVINSRDYIYVGKI